MTALTFILSEVFLVVGFILGWVFSEKFQDYMAKSRHHFEELFEENPHPELYDDEGNLNRGDYLTLNFEPGYDPETFDPEDLYEEG